MKTPNSNAFSFDPRPCTTHNQVRPLIGPLSPTVHLRLHPYLLRMKSGRFGGGIRFVLLYGVIAALVVVSVTRSSPTSYTPTANTNESAARRTIAASKMESAAMVAVPTVHENIAIVVPGLGHLERLPLLNETLRALQRSTTNSTVTFACIVYVWNEQMLQLANETLDLCTVEFSQGLWTHHMLAVGTSAATQAVVDAATHVAVMIDDMDAQTVNLPFMLRIMREAKLDVSGPSVPDWNRASCATRAHCMVHLTGHIDILFTIFTRPMWTCWQSHLDTNINEYGWGFDLTMADLCHAQLGIVDHQIAYHRPDCADTDKDKCKASTYDGHKAYEQMFEWIKAAMNYTTRPEANQYFHDVGIYRPERMPYCHLVNFHWSNKNDREDFDTLGGWQSVARGLNQTSYLTVVDTTPHNHVGSVELVANVDTLMTPVTEPWVGFVHSTWNKQLPAHLVSDNKESESFGLSAPKAIALFVFTSTMAASISDMLQQVGIGNIKVCRVHHPLPAVDAVFDPIVDLNAASSPKSAVVLVGQQYSRVASLHKLHTTRTKIWLPNRFEANATDKGWADTLTQRELVAERVTLDAKVQQKQLANWPEYSLLMRRNLVLVDVWAADAIEAVVQAIALQAPFFIRKLDGPVEYLGDNYPLFFTDLDQVQKLMNDETLLRPKLLDAHNYLELLSSANTYTPTVLAEEMLNCTLDGMSQWAKPQTAR